MAVKPVRAYLDASVFGGPFDEEFAEPSREMFEAIARGAIIPVISETLVGEIAGAPTDVQDLLDDALRSGGHPDPGGPREDPGGAR